MHLSVFRLIELDFLPLHMSPYILCLRPSVPTSSVYPDHLATFPDILPCLFWLIDCLEAYALSAHLPLHYTYHTVACTSTHRCKHHHIYLWIKRSTAIQQHEPFYTSNREFARRSHSCCFHRPNNYQHCRQVWFGSGYLDVLPPEVRGVVGEYSFGDQRAERSHGHLVKRPPLLMVSKIVTAEAFTTFLTQTPFQMRPVNIGLPAGRLAGWVTNLPLEYVRQMKHVYIPFMVCFPPGSKEYDEIVMFLSVHFVSKDHPVVTIEQDWGDGAIPLERY